MAFRTAKRIIALAAAASLALAAPVGAEPIGYYDWIHREWRSYPEWYSEETPTCKELVQDFLDSQGRPKAGAARVLKISISNNEKIMIAKMVMAESEGEPQKGKQLVAATILNRVKSGNFPDSVEKVLFQPGQFTSIENGRYAKAKATPEALSAVEAELDSSIDTEIMFFSAGGYSKYGMPAYKYGGHFFSKEK